MTDEEALREIDRQEKRFAAAKCGRGLQLGDGLVVRPLAPASWDWWRVDGIRYHGKSLTILFDRDGTRYGRGKGLRAFLDGKPTICERPDRREGKERPAVQEQGLSGGY